MKIFVQVVESNGFTAAGRQLRMSTAVVSSRIIRLENKYNVRLLHRTTRSVRPTDEGKLFYESCKKILAEAEAVDSMLTELRQTPSGELTISVPISLGRSIIAPGIPGFLDQHPDISLRFRTTDRLVDLIEEEYDLVIRKGEPDPSTLVMKNLAPDLRIVCGAPSYFDRHGVPRTPDDLKNHNCLLLRFPGSRRFTWQLKSPAGELDRYRISGNADTDSSDVLVDWAVAGHGLMMKSVWDIADHLESGALVGCLAPYWPDGLTVYSLMPPRNPQPAKVRYLIEFLSDLFAGHGAMRFTDPRNVKTAS